MNERWVYSRLCVRRIHTGTRESVGREMKACEGRTQRRERIKTRPALQRRP